MRKSLAISVFAHALLVALLIWGDQIHLEIQKKRMERRDASSVIQIDLTYKASDSAMRLGKQKKDLPPPDVKIPEREVVKEKITVKEKLKEKKDRISEKKEVLNARNILKNTLSKLRNESEKEDRPIPKIDNFPLNEKGEVGARGTGGRGQRTLSPGELALQAAMRRHFGLTDAKNFRKSYPGASGYLEVALVGVGDQFEIRSLRILESTGFTILDQSCERAIRSAIENEKFSNDVIAELSGKDNPVICKP